MDFIYVSLLHPKAKTTLASSCGMRSNGVLEHARVLGNATNDDPFARASERAGNRNLKPDREIMKAPGATERLTEGEHVRMIFEHSLPIFSNHAINIF